MGSPQERVCGWQRRSEAKSGGRDRRSKTGAGRGLGVAAAEGAGDGGGDELADVAVELGDLSDHGGGDVGEVGGGHEEVGFDVGGELAVGEGHLEFVLEVGKGAEATDDDVDALGAGPVDEEPVEGHDLDVGEPREAGLGKGDALVDVEEQVLVGMGGDGQDERGEDAGGADGDIEVSAGHGVEGAGVDGGAGGGRQRGGGGGELCGFHGLSGGVSGVLRLGGGGRG